MDTDSLREYLGIVLDLEKNILLRKQLIKSLTKNVNQLGIHHTFTKPIKPQEWLPPAEPQSSYAVYEEPPRTSLGCLSVVVWFLLYIIIGVVIQFIFGDKFYREEFIASLTISIILTPFLAILSRRYIESVRRRKIFRKMVQINLEAMQQRDEKDAQQKREQAEKVWMESMGRYHSDLRTYQQNIANDEKRVRLENKQKELLQREIDRLKLDMRDSEQRLAQIYAKNIVFPKYQNLVAISSLYEYVCAGRCSSLEGHEGAYNIYESEVHLDRIVTKLDQVIAHLDAIRNNQFVLFTAVQEINQQCERILQSVQDISQKSRHILEAAWDVSDNIVLQMDSINGQTDHISMQLQELEKTSALNAYHTERNQRELAYMNRMDYLAGRNDDVFWNHPPV